MKAILSAIWNAMTTMAFLPLALLASVGQAASQSSSLPCPVRRAAKSMGDLASARLVRRYAKALTSGHDLPDLKRLPQATRSYAEKLSQADAARVSRLSAEQVLREIGPQPVDERKRAQAVPEPRPSQIPAHVRKRICEQRRRGVRPARTGQPEPANDTCEPEPAVVPRA